MSRKPNEARLADHYNQHGVDRADWAPKRRLIKKDPLDVTISVRFTEQEISMLRAAAERSGVKVTAYIRHSALASRQPPLDRDQVMQAAESLAQGVDRLRAIAGP